MSEDGGKQDLVFIWDNQPWGVSIPNNAGDINEKAATSEPPKAGSSDKQKGKFEGHANFIELDKKQGHVDANRTENGDGKELKIGESNHDLHIWTERESREKMRNMFTSLHELLPHCPIKHLFQASVVEDEAEQSSAGY